MTDKKNFDYIVFSNSHAKIDHKKGFIIPKNNGKNCQIVLTSLPGMFASSQSYNKEYKNKKSLLNYNEIISYNSGDYIYDIYLSLNIGENPRDVKFFFAIDTKDLTEDELERMEFEIKQGNVDKARHDILEDYYKNQNIIGKLFINHDMYKGKYKLSEMCNYINKKYPSKSWKLYVYGCLKINEEVTCPYVMEEFNVKNYDNLVYSSDLKYTVEYSRKILGYILENSNEFLINFENYNESVNFPPFNFSLNNLIKVDGNKSKLTYEYLIENYKKILEENEDTFIIFVFFLEDKNTKKGLSIHLFPFKNENNEMTLSKLIKIITHGTEEFKESYGFNDESGLTNYKEYINNPYNKYKITLPYILLYRNYKEDKDKYITNAREFDDILNDNIVTSINFRREYPDISNEIMQNINKPNNIFRNFIPKLIQKLNQYEGLDKNKIKKLSTCLNDVNHNDGFVIPYEMICFLYNKPIKGKQKDKQKQIKIINKIINIFLKSLSD